MVPAAKDNPKQTPSLEDWKKREYRSLGFTDYQSKRLMQVPGLDVGSVRKIINQGCKIDVAYRIFRP